jgi:hypothetical protein
VDEKEITMVRKLFFAVMLGAATIAATPSQAQELIETYVARLSKTDHLNSNEEPLRSAAAIIRQDRANYHRFNRRDPEDEGDSFFADEGNREALEQMIERGRPTPKTRSRIVYGTPLIRVDVYRGSVGYFVRLAFLN